MDNNSINMVLGLEFSLLNTDLFAGFEYEGEEGYTVLLTPTKQTGSEGVSISDLVADIKKLMSKTNEIIDYTSMENDLNNAVKADGKKDVIIKLQMAYLYVHKEKDMENPVIRYAFQLTAEAKNIIPQEIQKIVNVKRATLSVWNTESSKVLETMQLLRIQDYVDEKIGVAAI